MSPRRDRMLSGNTTAWTPRTAVLHLSLARARLLHTLSQSCSLHPWILAYVSLSPALIDTLTQSTIGIWSIILSNNTPLVVRATSIPTCLVYSINEPISLCKIGRAHV